MAEFQGHSWEDFSEVRWVLLAESLQVLQLHSAVQWQELTGREGSRNEEISEVDCASIP